MRLEPSLHTHARGPEPSARPPSTPGRGTSFSPQRPSQPFPSSFARAQVVVCNANAPGVPLEVLSCELAAASGRATPCGEGIRRFALPASRAALGARPARALAEANAVDAAGAASVADAAGAAGAAGAPGAPAPQGSADGEAEAGVASSARGESAGPATPAPEPAANASAPAFTSAQPSEGGAAAQPEAAPAPATPTPAPGTPAPEPAPIPPDAPRKIPTVALHPLPTPLPPAAPASNANATATPALPPARMHCIGIASHLGPAERYEHLDVSLRVHTELFPPPPTPRAVHIWLLGDAEYETVMHAGGEPLEEGGSVGGGAEAAPRSRAGAPRPLRPRAPLPEPDLYSVEVKYLTRVALDQVETVSLAQGSRAGGSDGSDHRTLHSFFAFYSRALGFDERLIHPSGDEPGGEGGARAGRRGESEREGAGARADAAGDLSPDEARALALERAHSAQAGAAQTFDGGLVGLPAREAARLVRYTPSVSIQQVQGPFQSLDCVFLELRWRSTDVTVRTQYVTFTWTQLLAGIFATTTFTTLARSLLIWTLELLVHYGRWLLLVAAAAWRRRQRGERAAAADADPEGGGLGPGEGRAATAPAAQHGGYDKLD